MKRIATLAVVAALVVSCSDSFTPDPGAPNIAVSDGAHVAANGLYGNQNFFFLPPIVESPPEFTGNFNPYLKPTVEIFELGTWTSEYVDGVLTKVPSYDPASLVCDSDATPLEALGPVVLDVDGERYSVGWDTDLTVVGFDYRVCVKAEGNILGYRDVRPDANGSDVPRNTSQLPVLEYNHGSNLPIKFRIESGALCDIGGEVRDCTVARLDSDGGTAVCDNATCSLAVPTGAITTGQEFLFTIERVACTYEHLSLTDSVVDYLDIDLPQYGGCMRITATGDQQFTGLQTEAIAAACIVTDLEFPQDDYLQLHIQYPDNNVEALPTAASEALDCEDFTNSIQVTSLSGRLMQHAKNSWAGVQRALGPWFSPAPLEATHKGFGGSTTLSCTDGGAAVSGIDGPMLAAGSTSCDGARGAIAGLEGENPQPEPAVALLAWALPAQMEKYQWENPKIVAMGDIVTATVKVWDDPDASGYEYEQRPVAGAWVNFTVFQGSPLVPEIVRARTNDQGLASVEWPLYPDGQLLLDATGFGIGVTPEEGGSGAYADHLGGPFLLGEGKVTFEALACGPGITAFDGSIEGDPYILVTDQAVANLSGGGAPMEIYYSYDCDNIYFAVRVQASEDLNNTIRIVFDDDNDGASEFDDVLSFEKDKKGNWTIHDWWLTAKCVGSKQASCGEVDPEGSALPDAKVGFDGTWFAYEIQRPFGGTDRYDLEDLKLGDTVGFYLALQLGKGAQGNTEWPDFRVYHPLTLAPEPVAQ